MTKRTVIYKISNSETFLSMNLPRKNTNIEGSNMALTLDSPLTLTVREIRPGTKQRLIFLSPPKLLPLTRWCVINIDLASECNLLCNYHFYLFIKIIIYIKLYIQTLIYFTFYFFFATNLRYSLFMYRTRNVSISKVLFVKLNTN